jgi:hypothetical protein
VKTFAVWLMIALWLSSGLIAHPHRSRLAPHDSSQTTSFLADEAGLDEGSAPAILPVQQVRAFGARLTGPAADSPPFFLFRSRSVLIPDVSLPSDASGLKLVALAQTWRFRLRTASYPRSPSPA